MLRNRPVLALLATLSLVLASACTTTYTRDGVEMPREYVEAMEARKDKDPVDVNIVRINAVVEAVSYERGPKLLRSLQWLIAQRELALPIIIEHLEGLDIRSRAHLLYVLGFTRTKESTAALAANMHHSDEIVRFEAASGLLSHGDTTAVPVLISYLESDDRRFRYKAIEVLKKVLGQDFDYEFAAPAEIRNVAVGRWRSWWESEKSRLMYRPGDDERVVNG